jgi:hypothetical protein
MARSVAFLQEIFHAAANALVFVGGESLHEAALIGAAREGGSQRFFAHRERELRLGEAFGDARR